MLAQTLKILIRANHAPDFRKVLSILKEQGFKFEYGETPGGTETEIHFIITSEESFFFFKLGEGFGTIRQFKK